MRIPPAVPVLALPDGSVRCGVARPFVVGGLDDAERAFVASLEGGREITSSDRRRMGRALRAIEPALRQAERPAGRVAVAGAGPVAAAVRACLTLEGATLVGLDSAPSVAVVVALASPDPCAITPLTQQGIPHIVVAADEQGAWVSHVIVPGVTPCARCRDLALARDDVDWPHVALQCARRVPSAPPVLAWATAAIVAARILAFVRAGVTGVGTRVGADALSAPAPARPWAECGCGAAGAVGDAVAARRARMPR